MQRLKKLFIASALALAGCLFTSQTDAAFTNDRVLTQSIKSVTGIAEVYGDGEKISAAILEYPENINPKAISIDNFRVEGKTIEAVFVNYNPILPKKSRLGRYVILKFANQNTASDGTLSPKSASDKSQKKKPDSKDAPMRSDRKLPDLSFSVEQIGNIKSYEGAIFLPTSKAIESTSTQAATIESFKQFVYTNSDGVSMPYNLYLPKKYNPDKQYPLIFFVADASANINEVTTPLFQGNGATVFAEPQWQKKHECIVLAPQYTANLVNSLGMMTTDENIWTPGLTLISELLFDVIDKYSIDKNRIYGTGQSQGGMTNIAISDKYPDLFAAQYLVACQWNVDEMEVLKDKNLWITVCEGDTKAFPGMNSAVERWELLSSKVARNSIFWDSKAPVTELNKQVKSMIKANPKANINYTVFKGGNHMYTWSFAYNIDSIREWLFSKNKTSLK